MHWSAIGQRCDRGDVSGEGQKQAVRIREAPASAYAARGIQSGPPALLDAIKLGHPRANPPPRPQKMSRVVLPYRTASKIKHDPPPPKPLQTERPNTEPLFLGQKRHTCLTRKNGTALITELLLRPTGGSQLPSPLPTARSIGKRLFYFQQDFCHIKTRSLAAASLHTSHCTITCHRNAMV